jgi:RNA polymerase sigma-70 factor, ECF subfamily
VSKGTVVDNSTDPAIRFDQLFDDHYQAVYRYCVRRVGITDAEDATADVFAVAWRRLDEMPEDASTRAWLYGVAYRVVGNQYRTRLRNLRLVARLGSMAAGVPKPPGPEADQQIETLYRALDSLSQADRELIRLSSWDGLTRGEIAGVLGIRENAVDQRLHRARARLKSRMARFDPTFTDSEEIPK